MLGLMQDWQLLCHRVIDHAATYHGARSVVSRSIEGPIHTTNYAEIRARALRVAQRLERDGIKLGDRMATLAWNTWRHLEAWYGILGIGAIYHTVNPRLFPEQIVWIINHAEDRVVFTDLTFLPLLEKLAAKLPTVERYIVLTDAAHMPQTTLRNAVAYELWIAEVDGDFAWKSFDENTAAGMCYTSGTTGNPKGVVYSHRSNILHALCALQPDAFGMSSCDIAMAVVPLFHANGWSLAFSVPMAGASLVMPGMKLDGASIYELLTSCRVTCTAAVPTVWMMLLQYLDADRRPAAGSQAGGDRRLRLSARDNAKISGCLWRQGDPCLGHDGDVAARHAGLAQAGICRAHRRSTARRPAKTGPSAVRRGDEDRG